MDKAKIEKAARSLQLEIWRHRRTLLGSEHVHPFDALDPQIAAHVLGVNKFEYVERLRFVVSDGGYESAGLLDRSRETILIATRFGDQVAKFTAGHELGHWDLHPGKIRFHRDVPIAGLEREVKEPREREADYYSACFLMPAKLVTNLFHDMFLTGGKPFVFNQATLYNLGADDTDALLYPDIDSFEREITLARARSFGRRRFEKSLAEMFQVSPASMAIRLRELRLVRSWP